MRHIPHVTRWFTLGIICYVASASASEPHVLDLTQRHGVVKRSLGVPGSSGGGIAGQSSTSSSGVNSYSLPLRIRIDTLAKTSDGKLLVKLVLSNSGLFPLQVPSCLDESRAHGVGARDRHTLAFG